MNKFKEWGIAIKSFFKGFIKRKNKKYIIALILVLSVLSYVGYTWIFPDYGPSQVQKSPTKIIEEKESIEEVASEEIQATKTKTLNEFKAASEVVTAKPKVKPVKKHLSARVVRSQVQLKYRAKQVITRNDAFNSDSGLAVGSNVIGSLLMSVDTRANDTTVKVVLPYGANQSGDISIPRQAVLIGNYQYNQGAKRIPIKFTSCLFPDGKEYQIEAQALDSSDYRSGVKGEFHSNSTSRIATTLGLSMVAGMAEVFTEKVALGDGYSVTPKATMKNAFTQGTAKAANYELERQIQGMGSNANEYLTIESGKEVIISLTRTFRGIAVGK